MHRKCKLSRETGGVGVGIAPAVSLVKWGSQEYPLYCGGVRVVGSMHGTTLGRVAGAEVISPQRGSYRYDYCPQTPKGRRQVLNLRGHTVG